MFFLIPLITVSSLMIIWSYLAGYMFVSLFPDTHEALIGISVIGTLVFILGLIGTNMLPHRICSSMYFVGAIHLGAVSISGIMSIILMIIGSFYSYFYIEWYWFWIYIIVFLGLNAWGLYASWVQKVTHYSIKIDKKHSWHGKKIIMIADTHYGNIYGLRSVRALVQRINSLQGDIVIMPGDLFDGPLIDYDSIVQEFQHIDTPYGIFFANGNHEEYTHTKEILTSMKHPVLGIRKQQDTETLKNTITNGDHQITVINNKSIEIDGLILAGITYHATESRSGIEQQLDRLNLDPNLPTILLKHKPTYHDIIKKYPIDLVVSGHTHQAQMWPCSIIPYIIYGRYTYGITKNDTLTSITTTGVGSWGPPQRIGTRSEIVVITIE